MNKCYNTFQVHSVLFEVCLLCQPVWHSRSLACQSRAQILTVKTLFEVWHVFGLGSLQASEFHAVIPDVHCLCRNAISQSLNISSSLSANYRREHDGRGFKALVDRNTYWSANWFVLPRYRLVLLPAVIIMSDFFLSLAHSNKSVIACFPSRWYLRPIFFVFQYYSNHLHYCSKSKKEILSPASP